MTLHHGASLLTSVQNGPRTGGSFLFAPSASVIDGLLDVVVAGRVGRWGALTLLPKAMRGRHLEGARVVHASAKWVVIDADRPRVWHADGETFDPATSFELRVMEAALRVFAP
jgi:Sphingosine kinase and enzymes related to eukaryotic diacylglycerol kinase